jgi:ParB-like nuclease domain
VNLRSLTPRIVGVPAELWSAAGMEAFEPIASSYRPLIDFDGQPVLTVPISEVRPPMRNPGVEELVRPRALRILAGFLQDQAIPPIDVADQPFGRFRYRVCNGFHRFHLSVVAGFTHIPVIVQEGWETLDPDPGP